MHPIASPMSLEPVLLESPVPFSQSLLWRLQRSFFEQQGVDAWRRFIVPQFITSNAFIAESYARVVHAWLVDNASSLDRDAPVYVLELGAGSGRFAHYFLSHLLPRLQGSPVRDVRVCYVMSDLSERNLEHWQAHPALQRWMEQGVLDFARFDAEAPGDIALRRAGTVLGEGGLRNPLAVLANYFFDSVPLDVFQVRGGKIEQSLVGLTLPPASATDPEGGEGAATPGKVVRGPLEVPAPDLSDPALLERVELHWLHDACTQDYYADPEFNTILQEYRDALGDTSLRFPIASLEVCRLLRRISGDRLLLLAADKGFLHLDAMIDLSPPQLVLHGSFSLSVNFHALGRYFELAGGSVLRPAQRQDHLVVAGFVLGGAPDGWHTRQAFADAAGRFGPNEFFVLKSALENQRQALNLEELTTSLILAAADPDVAKRIIPLLCDKVDDATRAQRRDLFALMERVWGLYYHLDQEQDLPFNIGRLLHIMGYYPEALTYYDRSIGLYGPDPSTSYNMARCHYHLRQLEQARARVEETLRQDPTHEAARSLRIELRQALG